MELGKCFGAACFVTERRLRMSNGKAWLEYYSAWTHRQPLLDT